MAAWATDTYTVRHDDIVKVSAGVIITSITLPDSEDGGLTHPKFGIILEIKE